MKIIIFLILALFALSKTPDNQDRVLVISDNQAIYVTHSLFFNELKNQGYKLEFKNVHSPSLNLQQYGEFQYDHLLIFASSDEEIKGLKVKDVMAFFDSGRNVMLIGNGDQSKFFRYMFNGFGVDMHELGSAVYDHFNNVSPFDPTVVFTSNIIKQKTIAGSTSKPILYKGSGLSLTPYDTNQVFAIVRGSETAYSKNMDSEDEQSLIVGSSIAYMAAAQGRNNARVVIAGSYDLFSNQFLSNNQFGNFDLASAVVKWNFGQTGILKQGELVHRRLNSNDIKPINYRTSEDIYFSCEIFEWDHVKGVWKAFDVPEEEDLLLEFVMLDPYYRIPLKQNKQNREKYEVEYKLPDVYGIFQFKINYQRNGYSYLKIAEKITIRPFRHDEYPRYLTQAFPYYFSSFGTMAGFMVFVFYFLFHKE